MKFEPFHPSQEAEIKESLSRAAINRLIAEFTRAHYDRVERHIRAMIAQFEGFGQLPPNSELIDYGQIVYVDAIPLIGGNPALAFNCFFVWKRLVALGWRVDVSGENVSSVFSEVMPIDDCPRCVREFISNLPAPSHG